MICRFLVGKGLNEQIIGLLNKGRSMKEAAGFILLKLRDHLIFPLKD